MDFPSLPICTYFEYISGAARTSNSASYPRITICMLSSWSACRKAPGRSRIATSRSSLAYMMVVMKIDSVATVGDVADPGTAYSCCFLSWPTSLPLTTVSPVSFSIVFSFNIIMAERVLFFSSGVTSSLSHG